MNISATIDGACKVEIVCENDMTNIRLNDREPLKRVESIEFKHISGESPTLRINENVCKANNMKECSTSELVKLLAERTGVEEIMVEPYKDVEVKVNGPARILIVTD